MTLQKARAILKHWDAEHPDRKGYLGNIVQDARAANGEKPDPHGYYVQGQMEDGYMFLLAGPGKE